MWLRDLKRKHLLDFSEHVPIRFLICQYIINHNNSVVEGELKKWLTNDLNFDSNTVKITLYRMKGQERGASPKMLEQKNGMLCLIKPIPEFVLMKPSFWESWRTIIIPIGLLSVLFTFVLADLNWARVFVSFFFVSMLAWMFEDYVLRRIRFR